MFEMFLTDEIKNRLLSLGAWFGSSDSFVREDFTFEAPIRFQGIASQTLQFVGAYSYSHSGIGSGVAKIGRFCSISHSVSFAEFEHPTNWITTSSIGFDAASWHFHDPSLRGAGHIQTPSVEIGNDVWIGSHAYIRSGVKIGDGAIIGTRAVVTKDVPSFAVVAGSPARVMRYRFSDHLLSVMRMYPWWDYDIRKLDIDLIRDPSIFMQAIVRGEAPRFQPKIYSTPDFTRSEK